MKKSQKDMAALYIRVSTDAQREEGYSIDAQKEALIAYCTMKKIENYELFIDGGFTGSNLERPEMQRMIKKAKKKEITHCIVYKLDRLSRSQRDTLYLIEDILNPHGVDFISINETMDTSTPMGRLMLGILSAFAQLERENIRERTQMGMLERVKKGYWMGGGRVPFGYDYDSDKGILVPNDDAKTVKKIYDYYLKGLSAQAIANMVGLKYDRLVIQILTRKSNLGIIPYKGKEYQGRHEAIINRNTYDRAMQRMAERSKNHVSSSNNLLTGLLVCGKCGAKMHYQVWGKGDKKISCYSQQTNKSYLVKDPNCNQPKFWKEDIEEIVVKDLFQFSLKQRNAPDRSVEKHSIIEQLEEQQKTLEVKMKRLYNLYADDGNEILLDTINECKRKYQQLENQIKLQQEQNLILKTRNEIRSTVENLEEVWDILTVQEQKNIVNTLIEEIIITDYTIEVKYRL